MASVAAARINPKFGEGRMTVPWLYDVLWGVLPMLYLLVAFVVLGIEIKSDRDMAALPVLECIDFVSDVGGVNQAPQYVVVEVAESQGDAA